MKITLTIAALLAGMMTLSASAATTVFTDLSQDSSEGDITWSASDGIASGSVSELLSSTSNYATTITFNLNLTALINALSDESFTSTLLVDARTSSDSTSGAIGLILTSSGIQFSWQDSEWSTTSAYAITTNTLTSLAYEVDGVSYVTLTFSVDARLDSAQGSAVYDSDGNLVPVNDTTDTYLSYTTLRQSLELTAVYANTDYVTALAITSGVADTEELATAVAGVTVASVPEPATASLSILGLGAILLRRRRH